PPLPSRRSSDLPLANTNTPGGATITDLANQPADGSFLIDVFTDENGDLGDGVPAEIASHVDAERVGTVGHSLGGATVFGIGYGECCADDRLDAVVAWSGMGILARSQDPDSTDRPLLMIH